MGDVQLSSKGLFNERYSSNSGNLLKNKDQPNFKENMCSFNISYPSCGIGSFYDRGRPNSSTVIPELQRWCLRQFLEQETY
jgi:hypothetical protein